MTIKKVIPLFLAVFLLTGAALYLYPKIFSEPALLGRTRLPSLSEPDSRQWKTYVSDAYGFSFSYPPDWKISKERRVPTLPSQAGADWVIVTASPEDYVFKDGTQAPPGYFIVSVNNPLREKPADTGWAEDPFLTESREIVAANGKYSVFLALLDEDKVTLERMSNSFKVAD